MRVIGVFILQINSNIKEFDPSRCAMFGIEKLMRAIGISPNYGGESNFSPAIKPDVGGSRELKSNSSQFVM